MVPSIVPVYSAVLALIYIALSARVIQVRRSAKVAIGTRGNVRLERAMRVHANFAEYVPFALLLAAFIEMQSRPAWLIHLLCLALLDASFMPTVSLRNTRITDYAWQAWRRPLLSLP